MSSKNFKLIDWIVPLVLLTGLTIPFWVTDADVAVQEMVMRRIAGRYGDHAIIGEEAARADSLAAGSTSIR